MSLEQVGYDEHLQRIHEARMRIVAELLPAADVILDLGGANAPLHHMGYPHPFSKMTMVDLPPEHRHEMYASIQVSEHSPTGGLVEILYSDMTSLPMIGNESVDLVWSGQSIEHVPEPAGRRMCAEAYRVLRPGGAFCLDTPNGIISSRHARTANLEFIHPEHCIEYRPEDLCAMLIAAGFHVHLRRGVRHMPKTSKGMGFHYSDFVTGDSFSDDMDGSYIQFFHCRKPAET